MTNDLRKALRCRNYAEELRIIAADKAMPENGRALLRIAASYDEMAENLEAIERARNMSPPRR